MLLLLLLIAGFRAEIISWCCCCCCCCCCCGCRPEVPLFLQSSSSSLAMLRKDLLQTCWLVAMWIYPGFFRELLSPSCCSLFSFSSFTPPPRKDAATAADFWHRKPRLLEEQKAEVQSEAGSAPESIGSCIKTQRSNTMSQLKCEFSARIS